MVEQDQIFAKCAWRLIPFMMLLFVVNYLDRVNVGFAALTLNKQLGFSPSVFGFGAGIFFAGYALCQVPVNVVIERVGATRSVFCIMALWGLVSASSALVNGPTSFYVLRFLLGVAEAGFFPGMVLYLTLWFPRSYRARFTSIFTTAIPLASIIGGPLSGAILGLSGLAGLKGWQWLFLLEGLPAIFLAFAVLKWLPKGPSAASWLSPREKELVLSAVEREDAASERNLWAALRNPRLLAIALVAFGNAVALYGIQLWLPQMIKGMGFSNLATGLVTALPYIAGAAAMILWGRSSDRRRERIWHIAIALLVAAMGLGLASIARAPLPTVIALTIAIVGSMAYFGPFFSLPSSFLSGPAMAGGIALISTFIALGGFVGPTLIGVIKQATGNYAAAMLVQSAGLVIATTIILMVGRAITSREIQTA
ncbi:MAG TPA: MFS transporter [Rhizomicrobium sp.]|nr:MFS transporter [Rhizomicrobium sp.]